ncbi:glycosyltransferase family 4 protein [Nonlabens mediterrranea]|uniref:Glycosyltransferase family 4 protein n=1 Tax=Nonlabens mediterrranea TaxID=1419947 RepID=A0ABS0A2N8_9FLAO|nr:glycosyltransferase family 4 protein [Nonlabens mediterrranea]
MNIAIFSPNKNPYSETFIQAHKNGLKGKVYYYYGKDFHIQLEGEDKIKRELSLLKKIKNKALGVKNSSVYWADLTHSINKNKIDIILIEYGTHAYRLMPLLKGVDIPVVVHFHGYDATVKSVIERVDNYKDVFLRANTVIAVSNKMKEMLLKIDCPKEKIVLNTYGPREEFLSVKATCHKKQFIAIGRFTDKKAPYYTILAFAQATKKCTEARLIMAGNGELLNASKNLVRHLGLESQVIFPGVIDSNTYKNYLKESRAFVQHSITADSGDMEGTPLAVLEASAAGVPVISTFHAGIPDVILHEKTGLLCEEHDVTKMASYMEQLLQDESKAIQYGKASQKRIKEKFTLKRHLDSLDKVFEKLIS